MPKHYYKVGIRKEYFPRELWPTNELTAYYEMFKVLAESRTHAAINVWNQHGDRLLKLMRPEAQQDGRYTSLEVNDPVHRIPTGRLHPIRVR